MKIILSRSIRYLAALLAMLVIIGLPGLSEISAATMVRKSPSHEVEQITRDLLAKLHTNKDRYKKDYHTFVDEVDRLLSPVVAFNSVARGVMGKYARLAKPAQIAQFAEVFKDSLIDFYGKAFLKLDDTQVAIQKVDPVPAAILQKYQRGALRQVPVTMTVKTSKRTLVISYSMVYRDNRWQLRNVIIDGINIGIQFRNQFHEAMNKYRSVQYVIDHWLAIMSSADGRDEPKKTRRRPGR